MSVNLDKNRSQIIGAWKNVVDDKSTTNWSLYGYEGQTNDLKVIECGDGGLEELTEELNSAKIMYAFVRVNDPKTSLTKYVLINWQGEGAPTLRKGTCANHIRDIAKILTGAHLTINARTEDDVEIDRIMGKLSAVGSAYSFKEPRLCQEEQRGPVGTNYARVIPAKEINVKDRDNFWKKEEEEERKRVELERERRQLELKRVEEERRTREEKEHIERERRNLSNDSKTSTVNSGPEKCLSSPPTSKLSPIQLSPTRTMTQAEEMRQQRNNEARQLIGSRVGTAKALFTQNSASGQLQHASSANCNFNNKAAPVKPVRNSIAQRINSLNNNNAISVSNSNNHNQQEHLMAINEFDKFGIEKKTTPQATTIPVHVVAKDKQEQEQSVISINTDVTDNVSNNKEKQIITSDTPNDIKELVNLPTEKNQSELYEDGDGDQYSTIKRSPYTKTNSNSQGTTPVDTEPPQQFKNNILEEHSEQLHLIDQNDIVSEDDIIYQDFMSDAGLKAKALYDYQAADASEITFDPGDVITHIDQIDEGWWQGLGPDGTYGLFPANYVELIQ